MQPTVITCLFACFQNYFQTKLVGCIVTYMELQLKSYI